MTEIDNKNETNNNKLINDNPNYDNKIIYKNHPTIILSPLKLIKFINVFLFFLFLGYVKDNGIKNIYKDSKRLKENININPEIITNSPMFKYIILGIIVIFALTFLYNFFIWKNSSIVLENDEISSKRIGLLGKVTKQTNIKSISNINISDSIIYKLFDIVLLSIDINSSETFNELDYKVILSRSKAYELKNKIESIGRNIDFIDMKNINDSSIEYEYKDTYNFNIKDYFTFIVMNNSIINIVFTVFGYFIDNKAGNILIFIGLIDIFRSFFRDINKAYNFSISRDQSNIKISYGLTSSRNYVIPIDKIINVNTNQSTIAKIFGYEHISIEAIGYGNNEMEIGLGSLYMRKKRLEEYRQRFLPEFSIDEIHNSSFNIDSEEESSEENSIKSNKIKELFSNNDKYNGAKSRYIKKDKSILYYHLSMNILIFTILGVLAYIPLKYLWIIPIPILLIIFFTLNSYYFFNCIIMKDNLYIVSGMLSSKTILLSNKKIESISIHQNIIQKKLGIGSLTIYIKDPSTGKSTESTALYDVKHFEPILDFYRNGEK